MACYCIIKPTPIKQFLIVYTKSIHGIFYYKNIDENKK